MIHTCYLAGEIKKINIHKPKDPKKTASAVLLVQYAVQRESSGIAAEFVNAGLIRVPSYKFPQLRANLAVGKNVEITGHLQGVFKSVMEDGYFTTQLVADRVDVGDEKDHLLATAPALS